MKARKKKMVVMLGAVVVFLLALAVGIGAWYLTSTHNTYKNVFYPGTTLNGMDISGLTVDEVKEQMERGAADYQLTVIFKDEQLLVKASDIHIMYNESLDLQALKDQQNLSKYE